MLTSLRIQNFRSIRDASVKLGQVNLFIGPNNSGKSNFLKWIEEASLRIFLYSIGQPHSFDWYEQNRPRAIDMNFTNPVSIHMELKEQYNEDKECEVVYSVSGRYGVVDAGETNSTIRAFLTTINGKAELDLSGSTPRIQGFVLPYAMVRERLAKCIVYKPAPEIFQIATAISPGNSFSREGRDIISFLFNLSQENPDSHAQLQKDFAQCVGNLTSVRTPINPDGSNTFKLRFFDKKGIGYWADEVSEGVLYFLALLCIIHQPDPPKLLLLEEPEKGIHPRRIKEVMDFIFELARLRDIQIILTSHSPYVVDHFADIPECISVFDRENGETVIRNAGDLISKTNDKLAAEGKKPIRYTDSLGEHWVSGFLGGVPV